MTLTVTTPPATTPVSYEQLTKHCRIDTDDERDLLIAYIEQATAHAEQMLNQSLVVRTMTAKFGQSEDVHLPRGPVIEIVSVKDASGNNVTHRHYRVGNSDRLDVSHSGPLTVIYTAGHATVPADIVGAIRVHAATLYAWREDKSAASATTVHNLDAFYKSRSFNPVIA